jgi:glycosyltransferase involved in cell wall biosynthesis
MKLPISVIILTYNEELNLENCLRNIVDWANEIIIVDSFSTDKTLEIAKKYTNKIAQRTFINQAEQFNWALDNLEIKNEWILRLDADEYLTEELKKEIGETLFNIGTSDVPNIDVNVRTSDVQKLEINGFYIKRRVYFMGRWIKHGGYYPTWFLRLFKKGKARSEQRAMDEHIVLLEGKAEKFKNDFIDDNKKNLTWWINKHNNYASREAAEVFNLRTSDVQKIDVNLGTSEVPKLEGQVGQKRWLKENFYYRLPLFCRAFFYFIYRYFFRLGFLDGKEGLIFHFLQGCWYRFLVDAKLYENRKRLKER